MAAFNKSKKKKDLPNENPIFPKTRSRATGRKAILIRGVSFSLKQKKKKTN